MKIKPKPLSKKNEKYLREVWERLNHFNLQNKEFPKIRIFDVHGYQVQTTEDKKRNFEIEEDKKMGTKLLWIAYNPKRESFFGNVHFCIFYERHKKPTRLKPTRLFILEKIDTDFLGELAYYLYHNSFGISNPSNLREKRKWLKQIVEMAVAFQWKEIGIFDDPTYRQFTKENWEDFYRFLKKEDYSKIFTEEGKKIALETLKILGVINKQ